MDIAVWTCLMCAESICALRVSDPGFVHAVTAHRHRCRARTLRQQAEECDKVAKRQDDLARELRAKAGIIEDYE